MTRTRIAFAILAIALFISLVFNFNQHKKLVENELEIAEHHSLFGQKDDQIAWLRAMYEKPQIHLTVYADREMIEALLRDQATTGWQYSFVPFNLPEGSDIDPFNPGCPGEDEFEDGPADENELLKHVIDPSEFVPKAYSRGPKVLQ